MHPLRNRHPARRRLIQLALLALGLLTTFSRRSPASVQTITTCEAIGCGGRFFYCDSYRWGGPSPGSRDCYKNILPGQGE